LQIFSKRFGAALSSLQDEYGVTVAKNNELARVFDCAKATSAHFVKKAVTPDQTFDVADLSSDGSTLGSAFGREEMDDPFLRRDHIGQLGHRAPPARTLPNLG
jgi:hypothetical protein